MIQINKKLYNALGICQKARGMVLGTSVTEAYILNQRAKLVLLSSSLSSRTIRKFKKLCEDNNIKILIIDDDGLLGRSVGRDDIKTMAITDYNFKEMICDIYNNEAGVSNGCQRK